MQGLLKFAILIFDFFSCNKKNWIIYTMMSSADAVLTNKPVQLASLGTKTTSLYYSEASSSTELIECTFNYQNVISLQSLTFGSSSQVNIPIDQFVGNVILHLRLEATTTNQTLCRGWGYAILSSLSFTIGASNTSAIYLQGDAILQAVLSQCETDEKRSQILALGGQEQIGVPTAGANAPVGTIPPYMDAYVLLPLPFSTACDKLPVDSTLLSNNIVVGIQFKSAASIYGGIDPRPTGFLTGEVMLRQGKLTAQEMSIRGELQTYPQLFYSYPFIHNQTFVSPSFDGSTTPSMPCSVDLNTFPNGDLLGIFCWVVADEDKTPTGFSSPNPWNCEDISDIQLTLNGSTLMNLPAQSYKLTGSLIGDQQASSFASSVIKPNPGGLAAGFFNYPKTCYMVYFDFSRLRAACVHDEMQNTFKLPNQILRMSFTTTRANAKFKLYAIYNVNSIILFQNGVSSIRIS